MARDPLSVAVIGAGHIGSIHAKSIRQIEALSPGLARLDYIVDVDPIRAKTLAKRYGGTPLRWEEAYTVKRADLAIIATPTETHRLVAERLAGLGVGALLVEKPLAHTLEDASFLVSLSRRVWVAAGHSERFNPAMVGVGRASGLGLVDGVDALETRRLGPFVERARRTDVIHDLAIHDFDIILSIVGEVPVKVYANMMEGLVSDLADYAVIILSFRYTMSGTTVGRISPVKERLTRIYTKLGSIVELDFLNFRVRAVSETGETQIPVPGTPPILREDLEVLNRLYNGDEPPVIAEEGFLTLYLCKKSIQSARARSMVEIAGDKDYSRYKSIIDTAGDRYSETSRKLLSRVKL